MASQIPLGCSPSLVRLRRNSHLFVRRIQQYYGCIRLLYPTHHQIRNTSFLSAILSNTCKLRQSPPRSRHRACAHPLIPSTPQSSTAPYHIGAVDVAFNPVENLGTLDYKHFVAQSSWLCVPLPTLRQHPHECQRTARGDGDWLNLTSFELSPTTPLPVSLAYPVLHLVIKIDEIVLRTSV